MKKFNHLQHINIHEALNGFVSGANPYLKTPVLVKLMFLTVIRERGVGVCAKLFWKIILFML